MHSILITHRNRWEHLEMCLWSIFRSAQECWVEDFEIVVVDSHSDPPDDTRPGCWLTADQFEHLRWINDERVMPIFNKPMLFNRAIAEARGDVLTFLDADAIVGRNWMAGVAKLTEDSSIIRLCYRVRYLPKGFYATWSAADSREKLLDGLFSRYDDFGLAYEAYIRHNHNRQAPGVVYGNSQFSVTREHLGDLRFNEEYFGRGFEDLEFNRQFERKFGPAYKGDMSLSPSYNLFHVMHDYRSDWATNDMLDVNCRRYKST